jgi:hypothetical protein
LAPASRSAANAAASAATAHSTAQYGQTSGSRLVRTRGADGREPGGFGSWHCRNAVYRVTTSRESVEPPSPPKVSGVAANETDSTRRPAATVSAIASATFSSNASSQPRTVTVRE